MADVEAVSCIKNEVFVYRIPARSSNRGYRAAEWKLDQPDWTGRLRVCTLGTKLTIRLDDKNTGELFAQCPVDGYPGPAIEQVLDSSRYFVIRLQDDSGRSAFIGIGFADRGDSFDLLVAIQDHFKWVKREALQLSAAEKTAIDPGPKLDLGFKEGQTIKLNIATKKKDDHSKPKTKAGGLSGGLLPPPPGGVKIAPPSRAPPSTVSPQHQPHNTLIQPASSAPSSQPPGSNNADLLMGLSAPTGPSPPMQAAQGLSGSDPWGDFASAGNQQRQQQPQQDSNWVSFE